MVCQAYLAEICQIRDQVARLGVPYIMMHSRGSPGGMHSRDHKVYSDVDVEVASELQQAVDAATAAGVRAWNIMLDPGIGFAKGAAENFHMLTAISRIRKHLKGTLPSVCYRFSLSTYIRTSAVPSVDACSGRAFEVFQGWIRILFAAAQFSA